MQPWIVATGVLAAALFLSVLSCSKESADSPSVTPEEVFRLSLRPRVDTLVYPGRDIALPFRVLSGGTDVLKVVSRESEGARVSVRLSGSRSRISFFSLFADTLIPKT